MPIAGAVEGKAKECILCGDVVSGGAAGMEAHAASACVVAARKPPLSLDMDSR